MVAVFSCFGIHVARSTSSDLGGKNFFTTRHTLEEMGVQVWCRNKHFVGAVH